MNGWDLVGSVLDSFERLFSLGVGERYPIV